MYATLANMVARFGEQELIQLTDRADPAMEVVDEAVFNVDALRADGYVNGYLRTRYALPMVTPDIGVVTAAENVTRYYLFGNGAPQYVKDGYDESTDWLKLVQSGKVLLDATLAPASTTGGAIGTAMFNESRNDFACRY